MSEIQLKATNVENKPVRIGDLPIIKTNILENAGQMDKGVVGGYNGAFPLTAASEGGIYLLPSTGKFYVCETAYNGSQLSAPNSNFVELSVWKNHDRLAKLKEKVLVIYNNNIKTERKFKLSGNLGYDSYFYIANHNNHSGIDFGIIFGGIRISGTGEYYPLRYIQLSTKIISFSEENGYLIMKKADDVQEQITFIPTNMFSDSKLIIEEISA